MTKTAYWLLYLLSSSSKYEVLAPFLMQYRAGKSLEQMGGLVDFYLGDFRQIIKQYRKETRG